MSTAAVNTGISPLVRDLVALTKPRVTLLVLSTAAVGMGIAPGALGPMRALWMLLGTWLCVASANALNTYAGGHSLLTVQVTPGANPASTGIAVQADLSAIGLSPTQAFYDDGSNGDFNAGDNLWSYNVTVPPGTSPGLKTMTATVKHFSAGFVGRQP